ncbi:hypothetical protein GCM10023189_52270 [Nibrella saemangeumensis]|uniref:Por secretion system C-terminal sorting domain-containing protein n=1 Tax=Nibrella saemangeumensis TaxID=1084526 RepID=A0ABP8NIK9_9BACT
MSKGWLTFLGLFAAVASGQAQNGNTDGSVVKITYPQSRAVFQRGNDNVSNIFISGNYYQPVDSIQARVLAEVPGQGINTDWTTVQRKPQGGVYQGPLRVFGGWYRLEVRAMSRGAVIGQDVMRKVGVGEVFIITGQSNAQGFQDYGAAGAADDRVNAVAYNNVTENSLADPPAPTFTQLNASALIGPRGQSAWCWGMLGDLIAQQYNVPVLFINTAWSGTTIRNWTESANGQITKNIFAIGTPFENFPQGMPYANLVIALRYYCSLQGLRAVLWQQGETDNIPLRLGREEYRAAMQFLVNKTRADTDRYPAWILARSSFNAGETSQNIIQAQNDVINTYNNNVYPGPYTDVIQIPRPDGVHFSGDGLRQLAQAWYESMNTVFFSSSLPLLPLPSPTVTVTCNSTNNALTVSLPEFYSAYRWQSGQNSRSINVTQPGTYRAILKDAKGNTYITPTIDITGPIQPAQPTIALSRQPNEPAAAQQQVCADSALSLTGISPALNQLVWSNGVANRTVAVATPGNYTVFAQNIYGCQSAPSAPINLIVRPKLQTPTVEQVGPFSIQASFPGVAPEQQFDWRRGSNLLNQNKMVAKVTTSGTYSARTKTVFTLGTGNNLTCVSTFSNTLDVVVDEDNLGLSVYPNPSRDGNIAVETLENLQNAQIQIFTLSGQEVFSMKVPVMDERKVINVAGLTLGQYIVRVKADGFNVAKRVLILH